MWKKKMYLDDKKKDATVNLQDTPALLLCIPKKRLSVLVENLKCKKHHGKARGGGGKRETSLFMRMCTSLHIHTETTR